MTTANIRTFLFEHTKDQYNLFTIMDVTLKVNEVELAIRMFLDSVKPTIKQLKMSHRNAHNILLTSGKIQLKILRNKGLPGQ